MVFKHDDNVRIDYKRYGTSIIPVVVINRKAKLFMVTTITNIAQYYNNSPLDFIKQKNLSQGADWVKITDSELTRLKGIKKEDGYDITPLGKVYLTESGLEAYLVSWSDKTNHKDRPCDEKFFAWCSDNLLSKKMSIPETGTKNKAVDTKQIETDKATIWKCISDIDGLYVDFKNIITLMDSLKDVLEQVKHFLAFSKQDTGFVDEFIYSMQSFSNAYKKLDEISKSLKSNVANDKYKVFVEEVMNPSLKKIVEGYMKLESK